MTARIDRATPDQAEGLTAIAHEAKAFWGYPDEWLARWQGELTVDADYVRSHQVHVLGEDGRVLGFFSLVPRERATGLWELDHMWVVPAAMGRGLGRLLFQHAVAVAREQGARTLKILSDPHAEPFYIRMGATTVGRENASIDGVERWLPVMELVLGDAPEPGSPDGP